VLVADPSCHELLSELLLPHLRLYLASAGGRGNSNNDEAMGPPLQLQRCVQLVQV
jgi:hypothetical protein